MFPVIEGPITECLLNIATDFDESNYFQVYIARERTGAEALFQEGAISKIVSCMKIEKNTDIRLSLIR